MPTISESNHLFTEIVVFTVEPEHQQPLIDAIVGEVDRWVKHRPGFISASYHKGLTELKLSITLSGNLKPIGRRSLKTHKTKFWAKRSNRLVSKKLTVIPIKCSE